MKYFRETTRNSIVIMGRKTFESLKVKPLPSRINIVISRDFSYPNVIVLSDIVQALRIARKLSKKKNMPIFVIGGASIYAQTIDMVDRLYVTHIMKTFEADTFFPEFENSFGMEETWAEEENLYNENPHYFSIYKRKKHTSD